MTTWLKQSTAAEVKLGPFLDTADGFTTMTGLTISQADVRLAKNGGDWAQKNESTTMVHEENGWYRCLLDTTDTNTLGILKLAINESGALPVWEDYMIVTAEAWDAMFAGSGVGLRADVRGWLGTTPATPTVAGVPEVDLTHVAGSTSDVSTIPASVAAILVDTGTTLDGRIPAALVGGRMDSSVGAMANNVVTAAAINTGAIDADALAADAGTEIAAAVWATVLETGFSADRIMRIVAAAVAGKVSGGPGSPVFRNLLDSQDQVMGTADASGNRSAASYGA